MDAKNVFQFNDEKRSIEIYKTDLPMPWINYLSNGKLHAIISQAGGGFLWYKSATDCRLTRYRMNNLPKDTPGFYIYIKDGDTIFSPTFRPVETDLDNFYAEHKGGVSTFYAEKNGLKCVLSFYISMQTDALIWDLSIENTTGENKQLQVFAYSELAQYLWNFEQMHSYYWRHMLNTFYDAENETLFYYYHFPISKNDYNTMPLVYFASNKKVSSYSGDRDAFIGNYRYEKNPIAVERGQCGNEEIQSGEACAALQVDISLAAGASENVKFYLGTSIGALKDYETARQKALLDVAMLRKDFGEQKNEVERWFEEYYDYFDCNIPDKVAQRHINTWGALNVLNTMRYSRAVNAEAPGVRKIGYRDSSQDALAFVFRNPKQAKDKLFLLLSKQLEDGSAVHETTDIEGDASVHRVRCDDHLWPIQLAYSLAAETSIDFLNEKIPLLAEDLTNPVGKITVWEHLLLAVDFTEKHKGVHGLPLTLHGDWNDIINKFSEQGKGESVFCAQQYVYSLDKLIELGEALGDDKNVDKLRKYRADMSSALEKFAWNGDWFYRCFNDDGKPIGGQSDAFGKIWINAQTWSVISKTGSTEQQLQAMDAVNKYLDKGMGLVKLYPGFESYPYSNDPFSSYNPGCGENGAVFCHAHTWGVIAEALLGRGNLAWKYYTDILPYNCIQKVGIETYKSEPYAWCSSILGAPNSKAGQGNVSHISGTAAWMDIAVREYILGFKPNVKGVVIDPCIPSEWKELSYKRQYKGCKVIVTIKNPNGKSKGDIRLNVDGIAMPSSFIQDEMFKKEIINIECEIV